MSLSNIDFKKSMPAIVWAFFIFILCVLPGKDLPKSDIIQLDKIVHFCFYFIFFWLILYGIKQKKLKHTIVLGLFCCFYGFCIECFQSAFLSDRFYDVLDIMANCVGTLSAMLSYQFAKSSGLLAK
jgi:VanZ family protein